MSNNLRSRQDVIISRFALSLVFVIFAVLAVVELAVALNVVLTQSLVRSALIGGCLLWTAVAVATWVQWAKKHELMGCPLVITAIAVGVMGGMVHVHPNLITFALWANVALSVLSIALITWFFPQNWKDCVITPA